MPDNPPAGAADLLDLLEQVELLLRRGNTPEGSVRAYARFLADDIAELRLSLDANPDRFDGSRETSGEVKPTGERHFPAALRSLGSREGPDAPEGFLESPRLRRTLQALARRFPWSSFYFPDSWSRTFIDDVAALKLIGPGTPVPAKRMAMGLFLMGPQVYYPIHAHAAEELYLLLAGTVSFRINPEDEWQAKRAGDLVLHRSQEPHEMRTQRAASLALYIWRGEIFQPSWYKGDMSSPEEPPKYPDM